MSRSHLLNTFKNYILLLAEDGDADFSFLQGSKFKAEGFDLKL